MSSVNRKPIFLDQREADVSFIVEPALNDVIVNQGLCAAIIAYSHHGESNYSIISSIGIPMAPFNGSRNVSFNSILESCYSSFPAPHVHSVGGSRFWKDLCSVNRISESWQKRMIFLPYESKEFDFSVLFFSEEGCQLDSKIKTLTEIMGNIVGNIIGLMTMKTLSENLKVMERYVKEVGHDIASSVQAIISKVRNVRRGFVTGPAVEAKLSEAESEIMATYRVADTLGITVDPDYNIRSAQDFNICDAVDSVITLIKSEADERHIDLIWEHPEEPMIIWGDRKAIESAITQYAMNAIKYGNGGSQIFIRIIHLKRRKATELSVKNTGIELDRDLGPRIWSFGERGRKALEYHVNGSGIGLYTVKKIITAHGGTVAHKSEKRNPNMVTFKFTIPNQNRLAKEKLWGQ